MLALVASLVISTPPASVDAWALRLAQNACALPSYSLENSAPLCIADLALDQLAAAVKKHGGSPKLYRALALVEEARGKYSEAADYAKLSDQKEALSTRLQTKISAAFAISDAAKPNAALSVVKLKGRFWAALICDPQKRLDYPADNGERYAARELAIYSIAGGKAKKAASKAITRELSEATLYAADLDKDGQDEAVVDCLFYGASWTPTTVIVGSASAKGWSFVETSIFEEPGFIDDADKDGIYEIGGAQCIGDIEHLSHAGQPRYPVVYRFEKGKLVNGDFHSKPSFNDVLSDIRKAKKDSPNDIELLSCEARALRAMGRKAEAQKVYQQARRLSKTKADAIWNGGVPWTAFGRE